MPAIKNFGYLWDRDRVYWGKKNNAGTLLGWNKKYGTIDFREQRGIYVLHSLDLQVVYVGQVGSGNQRLFNRLKQHSQSDQLWNHWRYFSWFGWRAVNSTGTTPYSRLKNSGSTDPSISGATSEFLNEIEAVLIQIVEPRLNRQGAIWINSPQFKQVDDEQLSLSDLPTIAARQAEIIENLKSLRSE